jgi:hypothetical protein
VQEGDADAAVERRPAGGRGESDGPRVEKVRRASSQWQRQLVDLTGRNRLLYYRGQQLGTLDLGAVDTPASPVNQSATDH